MKNKIFSAIASLAIAGAVMMMFIPLPTATANAQAPVFKYTCEVVSYDATGWGSANNLNTACSRAMYECRRLTQSYNVCVTNRWWQNY